MNNNNYEDNLIELSDCKKPYYIKHQSNPCKLKYDDYYDFFFIIQSDRLFFHYFLSLQLHMNELNQFGDIADSTSIITTCDDNYNNYWI